VPPAIEVRGVPHNNLRNLARFSALNLAELRRWSLFNIL
jgi:hypothetical protein